MRRNLAAVALAWTALLGVSTPALAKGALQLEPMESKKVRIDGALLEWPKSFVPLREKLSGTAGVGDTMVGYDNSYLYLALRMKDGSIARTAQAGSAEDHLTLELYFPGVAAGQKKPSSHRIDVFPGLPGKLPALVRVDGKTLEGAQAVEAVDEDDLVIEAHIPWSALPSASLLKVGLRGKLTYTDASSPGAVRGAVATSRGEGKTLPPFLLESESGLEAALLDPKHLSSVPAREAIGNVAGGPEYERVALYGSFLTIAGPGYKDGKQFYFNELDVERPDQVQRLELLDMNGDGLLEILLEKRLGQEKNGHTMLQVLSLGTDGAPVLVFSHQVALFTPRGEIKNHVEIRGSGREARIAISQDRADKLEPADLEGAALMSGTGNLLLPWESTGTSVFGWQGSGLALVEQLPLDPKSKRGQGRGRPEKAGKSPSPALDTPAPPKARPPTAEEMQDRLYALYRKDRGVGNKKPRFDLVTDLAEDAQMERALIHDKDLVVFGKGFKGGQSYTYITLGVKEASDILQVSTLDLTGDGKAEVLVHAVLSAKASEGLGGKVVTRQALFIYSIQGGALRRVFAAETGRLLGNDRILGGVRFVSGSSGLILELTRGHAIGFTEKTYPFPPDTSPAGGLMPLLLPWGSAELNRYTFRDGEFRPAPAP